MSKKFTFSYEGPESFYNFHSLVVDGVNLVMKANLFTCSELGFES